MSPTLLLAVVLGYFALLLGVAWATSRHADNESFFVGNRRSAWPLVAFGMVGTSLSGVTFVSVPGAVGTSGFTYLQIVAGQALGYAVVAFVLMPLYHRLGVSSIYGVLGARLGASAHRTGAAFFLLSRTLGATARLYLVIEVLQLSVLDALGVPLALTAAAIVVLILLYTFEGGVRTIVWTDTLQTATMLAGLALCTAMLLARLDLGAFDALAAMRAQGLARLVGTDPQRADFFVKQLTAGVFIAIAMTGLDQEMMQESISIGALRDAQKNLIVLAAVMLAVVTLFVYLGGLLHLAAPALGVTARGDRLFPALVVQALAPAVQLLFVLALVSALFPSADGALTALTSSFCLDLLGLPQRRGWSERRQRRVRQAVHLAFALAFYLLVLGFAALADPNMIWLILRVAAYTYGPLLGLFAFALVARRPLAGPWVPVVALAAPLVCGWIDLNQARLFGAWRIGLELLAVNGALTFAGLWLIARSQGAAASRSALE